MRLLKIVKNSSIHQKITTCRSAELYLIGKCKRNILKRAERDDSTKWYILGAKLFLDILNFL